MKRINVVAVVFLLTFCVLHLGVALGADLFVAPGASGDGSSWNSPLGSIQGALSISNVGDNIHVKQGTYNEEIVMVEWVDLYGGYSSSLTGTDISGRNPATYVTSISAAGLPIPSHVVTGANNATIDGFNLTGGQADPDEGAGMYNDLTSPTVVNCVFSDNRAVGGGGMSNYYSFPTIVNCIFSGNVANNWGGGIWNHYSSPTIVNCTFSSNNTYGYGGGMFNWHSFPTVMNCIFWGDSAQYTPEIYDSSSTSAVTYCDVEHGYGGPGDHNINQDPLFVGGLLPGGVWTQDATYSSSTFQTTFTDNLASWTPDSLTGRLVNPNTLQKLHFLIVTNTATTISVAGDATSIAGIGNSYGLLDYHLQDGSPCIDAGTEEGGPGVDFEIDPRPQGCIYDMGVDEFSVTTVDSDTDGFSDNEDNCPCTPNSYQEDVDGDGVGDVCDNCPNAVNPEQADADGDGIGNVCDAGLYIDKIVLKDLNNNIIKEDFSPLSNIRYKVKFTVDGYPNTLYKVVVTGKALSLYKPDGVNPEWKDKFDSPTKKRGKLYGGESGVVGWNRTIPSDATPGKKAKAKFTLKLKGYDPATVTWNLLGTFYGNKKFNIVW